MNKKMVFMFTGVILALCLTVIAAGTAGYLIFIKDDSSDNDNKNNQTQEDSQRIEYERSNGPVSKDAREEVQIEITSDYVDYDYYKAGDRKRSERIEISKEQYEELMEIYNDLDIKEIEAANECIGGGTTSLEVYDQENKRVLDGYWSDCVVKAGQEAQPDGSLSADPRPLEEYVIDNLL